MMHKHCHIVLVLHKYGKTTLFFMTRAFASKNAPYIYREVINRIGTDLPLLH